MEKHTSSGKAKQFSAALKKDPNKNDPNQAESSNDFTLQGDNVKDKRPQNLPAALEDAPSPSLYYSPSTSRFSSLFQSTISTFDKLELSDKEEEEEDAEKEEVALSKQAAVKQSKSPLARVSPVSECSSKSLCRSKSVSSLSSAGKKWESSLMRLPLTPPAEWDYTSSSSSSSSSTSNEWTIEAIYDRKKSPGRNGKTLYLVQWEGAYEPSWVEKDQLGGSKVLLYLYRQHQLRFKQWYAANRSDPERFIRTFEELEKAGESLLSHKMKIIFLQFPALKMEAKEKKKMMAKLFFACCKLVEALKAKKAATSDEEASDWEDGTDEKYGIVDYRLLIQWIEGKLKPKKK